MSADDQNGNLIVPDSMGRMNDPDGAAYIKGICGDSMEMYIVVKNDTLTDIMFFTDGCNSSRFCGATAVRLAKEKNLKEVLHLSPADVIDAWGSIPGGNVHCAILAVSTLHKAVADYLIRTENG
ncbi:MAG: iron-sulfur cluster assembly scaffold protein [Chitinispirillaceae bacterium]